MILVMIAAVVVVTSLRSSPTGNSDIVVDTPSRKISHGSHMVKEIQNIPSISQMPELPSGCEITALTMLLNWAGVNVDKQDIARLIPKGPVPVFSNNAYRGGNPDNAFIGDPFSSGGLGVYHRPIALILDRYLPGQSIDITDVEFDNVLKTIDSGRPVIVWATLDMAEPRLDMSWYDEKGQVIKWIVPEHAYLLAGYSDAEVIVNDPSMGKRLYYPLPEFKSRWEAMGRQAVTVSPKIAGKVVTTVLD